MLGLLVGCSIFALVDQCGCRGGWSQGGVWWDVRLLSRTGVAVLLDVSLPVVMVVVLVCLEVTRMDWVLVQGMRIFLLKLSRDWPGVGWLVVSLFLERLVGSGAASADGLLGADGAEGAGCCDGDREGVSGR